MYKELSLKQHICFILPTVCCVCMSVWLWEPREQRFLWHRERNGGSEMVRITDLREGGSGVRWTREKGERSETGPWWEWQGEWWKMEREGEGVIVDETASGKHRQREVVEKRKRSLSMSSSGTTISTLKERERKDGMKEIKREREINGDKTVKTDWAKD